VSGGIDDCDAATPEIGQAGMRAWINQDTVAGLMFAAIGLFGLWVSRDYQMGTVLRMGPGYVPRLLCLTLIGLGLLNAIKGFVTESEPLLGWHLRPLVTIVASVLAFALLLKPAGLAASAVLCVVIASFAGNQFRLVEAILLSVGLAAGVSLVFVTGLGLPINIWPL
jgi:putative tricarboxylic transport membrane protein